MIPSTADLDQRDRGLIAAHVSEQPVQPTTIYAPNPLPADIDWEQVGIILGVKIAQGHPADTPRRSTLLGQREGDLLGTETDPVDRVCEFPNLIRLRGLLELYGLAGPDADVAAGFVEGFALGLHVDLNSSVGGTSEGIGAAGSQGPAATDSGVSS